MDKVWRGKMYWMNITKKWHEHLEQVTEAEEVTILPAADFDAMTQAIEERDAAMSDLRICRGSFQQAAKDARNAEAERERELLRKEVRRMEKAVRKVAPKFQDLPHVLRSLLNNRPAEVRALVEAAGPSGATG